MNTNEQTEAPLSRWILEPEALELIEQTKSKRLKELGRTLPQRIKS